jgi:mannose-1-phosphate guanylyltransferase
MPRHYISILAGGSGERFWPYSRMHRPKHLLPIVGNSSLLEQALNRVKGLVEPSKITVITRKDQHTAFYEACPDLVANQIIEETVGRDTAAASVLATAIAASQHEDAVVGIFPADHLVKNVDAFRQAMNSAFALAQNQHGALVAVGIKPTYAATGYGYLKRGESIFQNNTIVHRVARFVEKPPLSQAKNYWISGEYYWIRGFYFCMVGFLYGAWNPCAPL